MALSICHLVNCCLGISNGNVYILNFLVPEAILCTTVWPKKADSILQACKTVFLYIGCSECIEMKQQCFQHSKQIILLSSHHCVVPFPLLPTPHTVLLCIEDDTPPLLMFSLWNHIPRRPFYSLSV